jgi:hypothetical protein
VLVGPALRGTYGKSSEQAAFFAAHDENGAKVSPIDEMLLARYHTPEDHHGITRAVQLRYEFDLLLHETVMAVTPSEE